MSYIGNSPITSAFLTDTFSGNASTTAFTMSVAPANTSSVIVAVTGVLQDPSTYSVSGTTLTFSAAPPTGTNNISVRYLGIPASGVTTTAYRTVTDATATAGQTSFSFPSYTVGYINVYRNGVLLSTSDYVATTGTTVVLNNAATAGDTITAESFYVSSVLNALPTTGGSISGQLTVNSATGQKPLIAQVNGTEVFEIDSSGNVGIGTSSPAVKLDVRGSSSFLVNATSPTAWVSVDSSLTTGSIYTQWNTSTSEGIFGSYTNHPIYFVTNNTRRITIDTSGNLLVGTTTQATGALLTVNGSIKGTITSGTAVASTSGTSIDFTGIPSWVKRITVMFNGVSTNGTSAPIVQIGTGAGPTITTTGYNGSAFSFTGGSNSSAYTTGFGTMLSSAGSASNTLYGALTITLVSGNTWVASGVISALNTITTSMTAGQIALGAALTAVRITTVNGTDTFDAGSINILYEG